jgi:hypothetical protein
MQRAAARPPRGACRHCTTLPAPSPGIGAARLLLIKLLLKLCTLLSQKFLDFGGSVAGGKGGCTGGAGNMWAAARGEVRARAARAGRWAGQRRTAGPAPRAHGIPGFVFACRYCC